jgi:ectoine hydroxylase-related dioxygenase (phytanoyl-CoA dioxygenase family)
VDDLPDLIDRDGFAVVENVLGLAEVLALADALERARSEATSLRRGGSVYGMRDVLRRVPEVRLLAESPALLALVRPVLGPDAFAVRGLVFDKTPEANWNVPWHRDLTIAVRQRRDAPGFGPWTTKAGIAHVRPPLDILRAMLTVRLHLDDAGETNGPLCVLPGSHRLADGDLGAWSGEGDGVLCPVQRGGALVMRPLLLHASSSSIEPGRRRVIHLEYAAVPLPEGLNWYEEVSVSDLSTRKP